ncbi:hypothetical protein A7982_13337 [Minicystis rosea]|nr:hypothetical protein A7982_13337 [Minicystis rosea]
MSGGAGGGSATTTTTGIGSTSSSGGCVGSCAEALTQGVLLCDSEKIPPLYQDLFGCGCGASLCADACAFSLCVHQPMDSDCDLCLKMHCAAAIINCGSH